ncbi:MAG: hypothetical protein NTW25_11585 [Candidatus Kapabacteria bacterium]|nr:hypothetical protein [Candidatus Kapabacteria bacterium]
MFRILNYIIRLFVVILGFLFIFEVLKLKSLDLNANKMMGIVFVLFGLYRLSILYFREKREIQNEDD